MPSAQFSVLKWCQATNRELFDRHYDEMSVMYHGQLDVV